MDAQTALASANKLYSRLIGRRPAFEVRHEYHEGRQPLNFATEEWRRANASRYSNFADNWCGPIVDAEAERVGVSGLRLGDSGEAEIDYRAATRKLWEAWQRNEMEMQSSMGFLSTLVTSRSFVIVWGDENDEAQISWETGTTVEIQYDWANPRLRRYAIKTWTDEDKEYLTLYEPEFLWKFQRDRLPANNDRASQADQGKADNTDGGWVPRELATEVWPLPNPLGVVPVVEMPNRPVLGGDPISEIQGAIAMQDAINLLWAYLFLAADYASMDARVVLGSGPPTVPVLDDNGQDTGARRPVDVKDLREKRLLYLDGKDVKIDSWSAAELSAFTEVIDQAVGHISAQTRTPPTYLVTKVGMSNVNADGLKASEVGLTKKVEDFWRHIKPRLREVFRLVALVENDQALAGLAAHASILVKNPEIRSESQLADSLLKKRQMGYPMEYLLELDGLDPVEIDRVMEMIRQEQSDPALQEQLAKLGGNGGNSSGGSSTV